MNKLVLLLVVARIALVEPQGFLSSPMSRTYIYSLFSQGIDIEAIGININTGIGVDIRAQQTFYWDNGWCGNQSQDLEYSTCGRCGDAPGNTNANQGGRYDKGIITGTYSAGSIIPVTVQVTENRRGFFQFELCPMVIENNNCFYRLTMVSGDRLIRNGNMMCSGEYQQNGAVNLKLQLPDNVTCKRCTLRWTYRTSYPPAPDACWNPNPAQTFRDCADICIN